MAPIPTGDPALDLMLGGGWPAGNVVELCGPHADRLLAGIRVLRERDPADDVIARASGAIRAGAVLAVRLPRWAFGRAAAALAPRARERAAVVLLVPDDALGDLHEVLAAGEARMRAQAAELVGEGPGDGASVRVEAGARGFVVRREPPSAAA